MLAADLNQLKGSATNKNSACELEKTKIDNYTTLNVDLSSLNLQMVSSDDDSYYISYTTSDSKEKEPVSYDVKNKILTLKEDSDSNSYTHIDIGFLTAFLSKDKDFMTDENVVTLYVPENAKFQNATLNSDLGNILLNHVCFESGTVSSGDGDIFIKNSTLKEVAVSASLGDVKAYEQEAWKDAQILPVVQEACMSTQFSHIFAGGYAAGYYSYKWAEVLDADAFSLFKQKGIFNQEVADSFRNNILSKGGTEHPMILYKRFREQEPSIDASLIRNGIKK